MENHLDVNVSDVIPSINDELFDLSYSNIPAIVILSIFSIVGTIGNAHAIFIYYKCYDQTVHRNNVINLAVVDLLVCAILVPYDISDMVYRTSVLSPVSCELLVYLECFGNLCSLSFLALIAFERHRKVCKPLHRQLTIKQGKIVCAVIICTCSTIPLPPLVFHLEHDHKSDNLTTASCTVKTSLENTRVEKVMLSLILAVTMCQQVICTVSYVCLLKKIHNQRHVFKQKENNFVSLNEISCVENTSCSTLNITDDKSNSNTTLPRRRVPNETDRKMSRRYVRSMRSTLVFLVATCISYGGCVVTAIVVSTIILNINPVPKLGNLFAVLLHMIYLNNFINPIVYCSMDTKFRRHCGLLYKGMYNKFVNKLK